MESLQIKPLEENFIERIVHIHQGVLGYTFNSRLGSDHLSYLYRAMAQDDKSYVGVALLDDQPVGVVSGTLDMDKIKMLLLNSFTPKQWTGVVLHTIRQPSLISEWWKGGIIGRSLYFEGELVRPTLTAIAVDPGYHGKGIGRNLVADLEGFFRLKHIQYYRLDTLTENHSARQFYKSLGFEQVESRADSVIFVKRIFDG